MHDGRWPPAASNERTIAPAATPTAAVVSVFRGEGAPLAPGRYRHAAFEPSLTFEVGEGWVGGHDHTEFFDIWHGEELVIGFARPSYVLDRGATVEAEGLAPRDALEAIAANAAEPGPIVETTVGGEDAFEVRFAVDRRTEILGGPEGALGVEPPWRQRIIALNVRGVLVLLVVQTTTRGTGPLQSAVLASVRFDG